MIVEVIKEIKKTEEEAQRIFESAQEKSKSEKADWDDAKLRQKEEAEREISKEIEKIREDAQRSTDSEIKRLVKKTDKEIEELEEIAQKHMNKAVDKIIDFILTGRS